MLHSNLRMQVWLQQIPKLDKGRYQPETRTDFNRNFGPNKTFYVPPKKMLILYF